MLQWLQSALTKVATVDEESCDRWRMKLIELDFIRLQLAHYKSRSTREMLQPQ